MLVKLVLPHHSVFSCTGYSHSFIIPHELYVILAESPKKSYWCFDWNYSYFRESKLYCFIYSYFLLYFCINQDKIDSAARKIKSLSVD